ncbi:MAG: transcription antitermination factor NusB, partial [Candidatus Subteraquimicrobiales bacterium]|nr:transcription antitermination factor NusB [Candidatus Subteraquimicrobiales bacterium]
METEKTSRELAFEIIHRIHTNESYANILLPKILSTSSFERRERAFITELVYGTIRSKGTLDWIIEQFSSRKLNMIDPKILDIIRLGCYQLIFTDKIPSHAACNESVKIAKKY